MTTNWTVAVLGAVLLLCGLACGQSPSLSASANTTASLQASPTQAAASPSGAVSSSGPTASFQASPSQPAASPSVGVTPSGPVASPSQTPQPNSNCTLCLSPDLLLGTAGKCTIYTVGSLTSQAADATGTICVGGTAVLDGFGLPNVTSPAEDNTTGIVLIAGGNVQLNGNAPTGTTLIGGSFILNGQPNDQFSANQTQLNQTLDFELASSQLQDLSDRYANLTANGQVAVAATESNQNILLLTGSDPVLVVIDLDACNPNPVNLPLFVSIPSNATAIINVRPLTQGCTSASFSNFDFPSDLWTPGLAARVVWNFVDVEGVDIFQVPMWGIILAPRATVTLTNALMNGAVFCNSFTLNSARVAAVPEAECPFNCTGVSASPSPSFAPVFPPSPTPSLIPSPSVNPQTYSALCITKDYLFGSASNCTLLATDNLDLSSSRVNGSLCSGVFANLTSVTLSSSFQYGIVGEGIVRWNGTVPQNLTALVAGTAIINNEVTNAFNSNITRVRETVDFLNLRPQFLQLLNLFPALFSFNPTFNNSDILLQGTSTFLNVFTVPLCNTTLNNLITRVVISCPLSSVVVVHLHGAPCFSNYTLPENWTVQVNPNLANNLVWVLHESSMLTINNNRWTGHIFAPNSTVVMNNSTLTGRVIAANIIHRNCTVLNARAVPCPLQCAASPSFAPIFEPTPSLVVSPSVGVGSPSPSVPALPSPSVEASASASIAPASESPAPSISSTFSVSASLSLTSSPGASLSASSAPASASASASPSASIAPSPCPTLCEGPYLFGSAGPCEVFVFDRFASDAESNGPVCIGKTGDLKNFGLNLSTASTFKFVLVSQGDVNLNGTTPAPGTALVAGNFVLNGQLTTEFKATESEVNAQVDFSALPSQFDELAQLFTGFTSLGQPAQRQTSRGTVLDFAGNLNNVNPFDWDACNPNPTRFPLTVSIPNGSVAIINVRALSGGCSVADFSNFDFPSDVWTPELASRVVWNFVDFTEINISSIPFYGTLFAPKATITATSAVITGHVIAKNFIEVSAETHFAPPAPCPPTACASS